MIREDIIQVKNRLVAILVDRGFHCLFVAPDSENGMDPEQEEIFEDDE
jgi:hypothetical protein